MRTVYLPIFLPFYVIIVSFFSFCRQDANKTVSNCATVGCSLSKKHNLALHKTQSVIISFFNTLLGATCTKAWGQTSKYYRAGQLIGACIM